MRNKRRICRKVGCTRLRNRLMGIIRRLEEENGEVLARKEELLDEISDLQCVEQNYKKFKKAFRQVWHYGRTAHRWKRLVVEMDESEKKQE